MKKKIIYILQSCVITDYIFKHPFLPFHPQPQGIRSARLE